MNIDVDCPISHQEEENINYLFRSCALAYTIWSIININCPSPNNTNSGIVYWIEYIWSRKIWCYELFMIPSKNFCYVTNIWSHFNNIVF